MSKRSTFEVYGDILVAIKYDIQKNCSARFSRIHDKSNLSCERFRAYIDALQKNSLIKVSKVGDQQEIRLTSKGIEYIEEYKRAGRFLRSFGLQEKYKDLV